MTDQNQKGFTIIELLLYTAVAGVLILAVAGFIPAIMSSREKNQTIAEVEAQGQHILNLITQTIRNAEGINSPSSGSSAASLSLDVVDAGSDPTVFNLSSTTLRATLGGGSAVDLTNSQVEASDLTFQNLTKTDSLGVIKFEFKLTHLNPENRQEFNYERTYYGTASLRQ